MSVTASESSSTRLFVIIMGLSQSLLIMNFIMSTKRGQECSYQFCLIIVTHQKYKQRDNLGAAHLHKGFNSNRARILSCCEMWRKALVVLALANLTATFKIDHEYEELHLLCSFETMNEQ